MSDRGVRVWFGGKLSVTDACACILVFDPEMVSVYGGLRLALYLFSCLLAIFRYRSHFAQFTG